MCDHCRVLTAPTEYCEQCKKYVPYTDVDDHASKILKSTCCVDCSEEVNIPCKDCSQVFPVYLLNDDLLCDQCEELAEYGNQVECNRCFKKLTIGRDVVINGKCRRCNEIEAGHRKCSYIGCHNTNIHDPETGLCDECFYKFDRANCLSCGLPLDSHNYMRSEKDPLQYFHSACLHNNKNMFRCSECDSNSYASVRYPGAKCGHHDHTLKTPEVKDYS